MYHYELVLTSLIVSLPLWDCKVRTSLFIYLKHKTQKYLEDELELGVLTSIL